MDSRRSKLVVGDWVEVRSREEILRTLDAKGQLDGVPFMPEMLQYCGKRFPVYKRAHKTCDTVFPIRGRWVDGTVHLGTRCDGQAHGGCQAGCLLFWKEAWLKPVDGQATHGASETTPSDARRDVPACTEQDVWTHARTAATNDGQTTYVCQATRLPYFTRELAWWDVRQYVQDYVSGNVGLGRILGGLVYSTYYKISQARIGLGRPMRWLYDKLSPLWGGPRFPRTPGRIPVGQPTPGSSLNLQPGDLVRVKSHEEILGTITADNRNRGMYWDAELVPYCGGTYRVLKRVTRIVDEKTGVMVEMKNPCIILDGVACQARYSPCRMFCPRAIYPFWREIWLERAE